MKTHYWYVFAVLSLSLSGFSRAAINEPIAINEANIDLAVETLSEDLRWHRLLHYKKGMFGSYKSIVDDPSFFLSDEGKHSPVKELVATIELFQDSSPQAIERVCKFPARRKFLEQAYTGAKDFIPRGDCSAYRTWREENKTEAVWLIFPSFFLNSPSSMFGHTLLRFDPKESVHSRSKLLSKAVNYAAQIDTNTGGISYAFKGLFGGHSGYFSMTSYYEKVKEYNRIENRDVWEYKLNVSPDEIDWMLLHLWELDEIKFDYFYTTQNCSYQLLSVLDVARPESDLTQEFDYVAIPVDTVRTLVEKKWIVDTAFRPSKSMQFYHHVSRLSDEERQLVADFRDQPFDDIEKKISVLPIERQRLILESGYKLLRLDKTLQKDKRKAIAVLKARSRMGLTDSDLEVTAPARPERGHLSRRISIGANFSHIGDSDTPDIFEGVVEYKTTYHSLDDPTTGFLKDSQINFLHGELHFSEDDVKLEKFDILNIRSLSPSDKFISRLAWQVSTGWQRRLFENDTQGLTRQLNAAAGKVYKLGELRVYGMLGGQLEWYDHNEDKNLQFGPRADAGLYYQGSRFYSHFQSVNTHYVESSLTRNDIEWENSLFLSQSMTMGLSLRYQQTNRESDTRSAHIMMHYYF